MNDLLKIKIGNKIKALRAGAFGTDIKVGDILIVTETPTSVYKFRATNITSGNNWGFNYNNDTEYPNWGDLFEPSHDVAPPLVVSVPKEVVVDTPKVLTRKAHKCQKCQQYSIDQSVCYCCGHNKLVVVAVTS